MNNLQLKLDVIWKSKKVTNNCVACSRENEVNMLQLISSSSLITTET